MGSQPEINVFTSSIMSSPAIRSKHERVARHLAGARLDYTSYDIVSDEAAKKYWKVSF